jgi:hypothetical protein
MSTPAADETAPQPSNTVTPTESPTALDSALVEKLIGGWRRVYRLWKPLEQKVDEARRAVVGLLVAAGVESYVSKKHGKISLQRKKTVDWEQMARDLITPKVIEGIIDRYTSTSSPFTRAPQSWAGEGKP